MPQQDKSSRKNHARRGLGVLMFLFPFGLIACSAGEKLLDLYKGRIPNLGVSMALMVMALLLGSLNFYLSHMRPMWFRNRPDYRFVSGIPLIGTLLVIAATIVGWSGVLPASLGLIALLLDTGGLPWFIVSTWSDASFWDSGVG